MDVTLRRLAQPADIAGAILLMASDHKWSEITSSHSNWKGLLGLEESVKIKRLI
ncbi:hypothetical protein KKA14_13275 [bacterium]|nr:hypothetical protein [bacterium]